MKTIKIKFRGIDNWNRPVFKDVNSKSHFGSTCRLFGYEEDPEKVKKFFRANPGELEYFGAYFGCEPNGGLKEGTTFEIID